MHENGSIRHPQGGPASAVRFPGEDAGRSLAEMAQHDLDAALQLLADRAQYITGASGAAIALRRGGMSDMLCRASTGSNAPELGALLSTEFGLSGESVRTRRALRCDDAERDTRVNREVCRQLGIASVVVMPVVHDDEVLGVFELFSGKANAFGERDLSAIQRLSQMVETAVRLAQVTENLPERLSTGESSVAEAAAEESGEEILDVSDLGMPGTDVAIAETPAAKSSEPAQEAAAVAAVPAVKTEAAESPIAAAPLSEPAAQTAVQAAAVTAAAPAIVDGPAKKKLFWSAAPDAAADDKKATDTDQSHVPPVLRGLRKCEVCGFPVSAGRVLCVECEERRWRGQLRRPAGAPLPTGALPAPAATAGVIASAASVAAPHKMAVEPLVPEVRAPELVLSGGLESPPSWISTHKVTVGIFLAVVGSILVVVLFR